MFVKQSRSGGRGVVRPRAAIMMVRRVWAGTKILSAVDWTAVNEKSRRRHRALGAARAAIMSVQAVSCWLALAHATHGAMRTREGAGAAMRDAWHAARREEKERLERLGAGGIRSQGGGGGKLGTTDLAPLEMAN